MKPTLKLLCALVLLCGSGACGRKTLLEGEPLSVRMVRSEMLRHPSPVTLDGIPEGKIKWNYTTGLELLSMMDVAASYGCEAMNDYVERYYDSIVRSDGSVITYKKSNYNLDHVCPARPLFALYERTGQERYKAVLDTVFVQLQEHPRRAQKSL